MRRALLPTVTAVLLMLALPGSSLAATFTYTIISDTCSASGGDYGYGQLYFEVRMTEYGKSGANKFTFSALAQEKNLGASRWRTDYRFGTFTYRFANTRANAWYTRRFWYNPEDFAWHRLKVTLKVWHNGILLAKKTLVGDDC